MPHRFRPERRHSWHLQQKVAIVQELCTHDLWPMKTERKLRDFDVDGAVTCIGVEIVFVAAPVFDLTGELINNVNSGKWGNHEVLAFWQLLQSGSRSPTSKQAECQ